MNFPTGTHPEYAKHTLYNTYINAKIKVDKLSEIDIEKYYFYNINNK